MTNTVKLKSQLYLFECRNCDSKFKFPVYPISDYSYGEFLLKSKNSNDLVYLYALTDKAFLELMKLVKNDKQTEGMGDAARSNIFQKIVGIAYDRGSDGGLLYVGLSPICPSCSDAHEKKYTETNPPEYKIIEVPKATSIDWDNLREEHKIEFVAAALAMEIS